MTTIKAFIERHPVATYFSLAFAISWGAILLAVGLDPLAISGVALLIYLLALAAAWWVFVAAVSVANGGHLSQQALRRRVA